MASVHSWRWATVREARPVADDVTLLTLEPEGGATPYPTGAHLDVEVLIGGQPAVRSYSLVGERPREGAWRIAVKRLPDSRGGSAYMSALSPGARLKVAAPASHFELKLGRPQYLLLAGGIGVTPLVGMAEVLARLGADVRMIYAARTPAQLALSDELEAILGPRLHLCASGGERLDLAAEVADLHPEAELYVCGPVRLMEAAQAAWTAASRPRDRLRLETFGSSGHRRAETFQVHVADHGVTLTVGRHESLLDRLAASGVDVASDCRRGECGLCAVHVLGVSGELDHRDVFFSAEQKAAGRELCVCVSRAVGDVTIDTGYRPESL